MRSVWTTAFGVSGVLLGSACNDTLEASELSAVTARFAVVSDNYSGATSISLLDENAAVERDAWVGSKSDNPELRTPLSEDVVLPTVSSDRRYLTTLERGLGVLTRFDLEDGSVLGQLRTDESPEDDQAAYHSNPQDVQYVTEHSAWVSRWEQNPNPDAKQRERGNDLIEWDPETFERTERRIDLSSLNQDIDEPRFDEDGNPDGTVTATAYASPAALVPVGAFTAVGITGITKNYNYAPGQLAIVDLDAAELVGTLDLEGLRNCGEVKPVPHERNSIVMGCIGAYGDGGEGAGLLKVTVDEAGDAKIMRSFHVADHSDAANTNSNLASLGGDIVVAVATGHIDPETMQADEPDRLMRVDLKTGEQTELWTSDGAFALGAPAFDPDSGILLVPDAGKTEAPSTGVQRFRVDAARKVSHKDFVEVAPDTGLAARQVLLL